MSKTPLLDALMQAPSMVLYMAAVSGPPQTKGSTRGFVNPRNGRVVVTNDNAKAKPWQDRMTWAMRQDAPAAPLKEPMALLVRAYLKRPATHYGSGRNRYTLKATAPARPVTKPDGDKILRLAADSGTGIWWFDDSYLVAWTVEKHYADEGQERVEALAWIVAEGRSG